MRANVDGAIAETVDAVRARITMLPAVGVVLDSDDGAFADRLRNAVTIEAASLPHMAAAERLVVGSVDDVAVACLVGRHPLGQGFPAWQLVHGARVLARLGIRIALVAEAAGIVEPTWHVGDVMLVLDHVNLATHEGLGTLANAPFTAFPPLATAYDVALAGELQEVVRTEKLISARLGTSTTVDVLEGVYANLQDPTYETPAQVAMLRTLGAHALGASLALEVTALRQVGVRTAAVAHLVRRAGGARDDAAINPTHLQKLLRGWVVRAARLDG